MLQILTGRLLLFKFNFHMQIYPILQSVIPWFFQLRTGAKLVKKDLEMPTANFWQVEILNIKYGESVK